MDVSRPSCVIKKLNYFSYINIDTTQEQLQGRLIDIFMQCPHIFASIAQFIDISDFETLYTLGTTCKGARKVCDTILSPYLSDLIYVEHDNNDAWRLYQVLDLKKKHEIDLGVPVSWPFMGIMRRRGLLAFCGFDTPCRFITTRKNIIHKKNYNSQCSCERCIRK